MSFLLFGMSCLAAAWNAGDLFGPLEWWWKLGHLLAVAVNTWTAATGLCMVRQGRRFWLASRECKRHIAAVRDSLESGQPVSMSYLQHHDEQSDAALADMKRIAESRPWLLELGKPPAPR